MDGKVIPPPSKKLATRKFISAVNILHKIYIRTCIIFKLERFQCLNFPALPIFQTHSWIYLPFVFQFTSLHDYQNMCVYICLFLKLFFFSLLFSFVWKLLHLYKNRINSKVCVTCIANVFRKNLDFLVGFCSCQTLIF